MRKYLIRLKHEFSLIKNSKIQHISLNKNCHTDALATIASVYDIKNQHSITISVLSRASPSEIVKVINQIEELVGVWFDTFDRYFSNGDLAEDKKKAYDIVNKSISYFLLENKLYRESLDSFSYQGIKLEPPQRGTRGIVWIIL